MYEDTPEIEAFQEPNPTGSLYADRLYTDAVGRLVQMAQTALNRTADDPEAISQILAQHDRDPSRAEPVVGTQKASFLYDPSTGMRTTILETHGELGTELAIEEYRPAVTGLLEAIRKVRRGRRHMQLRITSTGTNNAGDFVVVASNVATAADVDGLSTSVSRSQVVPEQAFWGRPGQQSPIRQKLGLLSHQDRWILHSAARAQAQAENTGQGISIIDPTATRLIQALFNAISCATRYIDFCIGVNRIVYNFDFIN